MNDAAGAVLIRGVIGAAARALAAGLKEAGWQVAVAAAEPAELPSDVYGIALQSRGAVDELGETRALLGRDLDLLVHATVPERAADDLSAAVAALESDMDALRKACAARRSFQRQEPGLGVLLLDAGAHLRPEAEQDAASTPEVVEGTLYGALRSVALTVAPDVRVNAIALDRHAYDSAGWEHDLLRAVGFIRSAKALHGQWITLGQPRLFRSAWPGCVQGG
ncbi:MAG: hypothetical protein QNJ92_10540 [Alphaproteobacteria bacterium]|nr:hypothetical protein [Alphaproteobacteria bacterium]